MPILLPFLVLIPALGAVFIALFGGEEPGQRARCRAMALFTSLVTAAVAAILTYAFFTTTPADNNLVRISFGGDASALTGIGFSLHLGIDSISLWLVILTAGLTPLAIFASYESIRDRTKQYYAWMLALHAAMLGCFIARDALLFYIFFELTLVPMFFIIGIWGGPDRRRAAGKFFLFTFAGSVFTLAAVVYLGVQAGNFDILEITRYAQTSLDPQTRGIILLALLAGFAVKVPLFPVHTWLPLAHTEAPTAGSVILAGVLLKLGTYGLLRFAWPIGLVQMGGISAIAAVAPAGLTALHILAVICIIGIIYAALVAWVQRDVKKLVAYSSVSHLGFCVLGLAALNSIGMQGSVLYMINHGISTGALFLCVGMFYDRYHTRDITLLSGLGRVMPRLAFFMVLFGFSSIGLPGTNGFVSEFLTILGAYTSPVLGTWYGAAAAIGVILGAIYMLHMLACVFFGPLKTPGHTDDSAHGDHAAPQMNDLTAREITILTPLAIAVLLLGVFPTGLLDSIRGPVDQARAPLVASAENVPPFSKRASSLLSSHPKNLASAPLTAVNIPTH